LPVVYFQIQILGAVIVFSFSIALALRKANFVSQINQPFAVVPALHSVLFRVLVMGDANEAKFSNPKKSHWAETRPKKV